METKKAKRTDGDENKVKPTIIICLFTNAIYIHLKNFCSLSVKH